MLHERIYPNIVRLIKFFSILPISNAEIERVFSSYSFIKNKLRNKLLDEYTDDLLYVYKKNIPQ